MKGGIYNSEEDCYKQIAEEMKHITSTNNNTDKDTDTSYNRFLLDAMGITKIPSKRYRKNTKASDGGSNYSGSTTMNLFTTMM